MSQLRPSLSTLETADFVWLLTITIGGRVLRRTTGEAVTITGRDGLLYEYTGGLAPVRVERLLELWNTTPSPRSLPFELLLDFDLALEVARGAPLHAATGELAQWYEDDPFEARRVVLRGSIEEPAVGAMGEPFAFSLSEDPTDDRALIPPSTHVVEEGVTFTESGNQGPDPGIVGASYPIVVGAPGQTVVAGTTSSVLSGQVPGTPALLVDRDATGGVTTTNYRILIAGHRVTASQVDIYNSTQQQVFTGTVQNDTDDLGQAYSYVNPAIAADIPAEGDSLYAIWDPADGGGVRSSSRVEALRGAGDVIRWALRESTLRVDHSRLGELDALNVFKIDTHINGSISPWAWLTREVLPLLPVQVATGPDGLAVVPFTLRRLQADQATVRLEEGRNCTRESSRVWDSDANVANEITLRFAPNAETGTHAGRVTITHADYKAADTLSHPHLWCRRSFGVWGSRQRTIDASVVFDVATAEALAVSLARRLTFPVSRILYTLDPTLDWVRPGDTALVTDAGMHLDEAVAIVGTLPYTGPSLGSQLVLFEPLVLEQ